VKKPFIFLIILFLGQFSSAQDEYQPFLDRSFLIVSSTLDFESAEKIAVEAKRRLKLNYPTSVYFPADSVGFKTNKQCECGNVHDYFPRGSHDAGNYVSIEYSSGYKGFTEGYYIVIVSSGQKSSVEKELRKAKKHFPQAYIKTAEIYVGCRH